MRMATTWLPPPCCGGCKASATGMRCRCARSATIDGSAAFEVDELGSYEYTVEGWIDWFATWRQDSRRRPRLSRTCRANSSRERRCCAPASDRVLDLHDRDALLDAASVFERASVSPVERVTAALSPELTYDSGPRPTAATRLGTSPSCRCSWNANARGLAPGMRCSRARRVPIRPAAPPSTKPPPDCPTSRRWDSTCSICRRSIRSAEASARVPTTLSIRGPSDPGSPWAIGSAEGGHTAIEPGLGTLRTSTLCRGRRRAGLEIALDIAFQASPDHPYVREHPEWFRHRPDGTIKYAENPPKKYQDIYPFDFESADWRALWRELTRVFTFWIGHGVRIFRVDNPHTKPFAFWQWAIADIGGGGPT